MGLLSTGSLFAWPGLYHCQTTGRSFLQVSHVVKPQLLSAAFPGSLTGAELEMEQPGHKLAAIKDADIATRLAHEFWFLTNLTQGYRSS